MQQPLKVPGILGVAVCCGGLQVVPDKLVRVQLWRVRWKAKDMQARMFGDVLPSQHRPVTSSTVPDQKHVPAKVLEQVPEETNHLGCLDVFALMKPGIQGDPGPLRRKAQS